MAETDAGEKDQRTPKAGQPAPGQTPSPNTGKWLIKLKKWLPWALGFATAAMLTYFVHKAIDTPATQGGQLSIIAYLAPGDNSLELRGRVLKEGDAVEK